MTEKLNTQITLPAWVVTAFILVFLAYMGFFTAQVMAQSATQTKVEALEKAMDKKADKDIVIQIQGDIREIRESTEDIKNMLLNN